MRVKIFANSDPAALETLLQNFITQIEKEGNYDYQVHYQVAMTTDGHTLLYMYSALILYK